MTSLVYLYRSAATQRPKRDLERSIEALNQLELSGESLDVKQQTSSSSAVLSADEQHKQALVMINSTYLLTYLLTIIIPPSLYSCMAE